MTAGVKDELSRLPITKTCCRKAEVSALLRFAGGLHLVAGKVVVEAELDTGAAARRARAAITDMFGHQATITVVSPAGIRRGNRYVLTVAQDGQRLAKQAGLLDNSGRPVRRWLMHRLLPFWLRRVAGRTRAPKAQGDQD